MSRIRLVLLTTVCLAAVSSDHTVGAQSPQPSNPGTPNPGVSPAPSAASPAPAARPRPARPLPSPGANAGSNDVISDIRVVGNERIESGTILSYMLVAPGDPANPDLIDRSLKTLFATGLFSDVTINRDGSALVVKVVENPLVNRVAFEGNHALGDDALRALLELRPRSVFTPEIARSDRQKILDAYAKKGRYGATVEPKIIRLPQNRVDVVFEISDGTATLVSRISFVGNHAFGESRLRDIIESRESAWYRFLSSSDSYDPARVEFDKELLRRFYLKNGYADFEVRDATAELAPDRNAFFLTFTLSEGAQYRVSSISVNSTLPALTSAELMPFVEQEKGEIYDGDAIERSVNAMQDAAEARGVNFVLVRPRIARNRAKHTVDLVFDVSEGPRVYVERIDIEGNTRTKDKVIRREMQLAEGDAFNPAAIRKSRQRLTELGYFNTVNITQSQGSTADKAVVDVAVDEKATGELSFGGGFSTDAGALLSAGLREKNLIGTGIDSSLSGTLAQRRSEIDLSATDPYFLDRNLVAGFDIFHVSNNNQDISNYDEARTGLSLRTGYQINPHLSQAINYSIVQRKREQRERRLQPLHPELGRHELVVPDRPDADVGLSRQPGGPACRLRAALRAGRGGAGRLGQIRAQQAGWHLLHPIRPLYRQQRLGLGDLRQRRLLVQPRRPPGGLDRPVLPGRRQPAWLPVGGRRAAYRAPDRLEQSKPPNAGRRQHRLWQRQRGRPLDLHAIHGVALPAARVGRSGLVRPCLCGCGWPCPGQAARGAVRLQLLRPAGAGRSGAAAQSPQ